MHIIGELWQRQQLPIDDGLFHADGHSYAVGVVDGRLRTGAPFDLDASLADDPGWVASIMITREVPISDGLAVHFQESNPFTEIVVHRGSLAFVGALDATAAEQR